MKKLILLIAVVAIAATNRAQQTIVVKAGDASSLLAAIDEANQRNAQRDAERLFILIPDGFYDLGETVLTTISGHNIALIGQSTEGTVIQNAPDIKNEGISKTGTIRNRGTNNYFQDLTLKNALKYYESGFAGRAVCLHDKGTRTICNRVRMLSYQDTYYSDNEDAQLYHSESEIHGTVDFICGAGDVWFERCRIVTERRSADGSGRCVIAAPRTSHTPWGYVFNRCTVENTVSGFDYARGWHTTPHCIWLYTTLLTPEKLGKTRFDHRGMRTVLSDFREYGTVDADGRSSIPASNIITFTLTQEKKTDGKVITTESERTVETIMTAAQAQAYTVENVFGEWRPDLVMKRLERQANRLRRKHLK